MNNNLTYEQKPMWPNRPISPRFSKSYGVFVFMMACLFLWKFHMHHASAVWQVCAAVLAIAVALSVAVQFRTKADKARPFWIWYQLAVILLILISLLRA